ncbi:MAG TPA: hypothetical protein VGI31_04685 [Streptosporangiaceae bacterium]
MPRTEAGPVATSGPRTSRWVTALRHHWLLTLLLVAGLVLRILTQIAYRPAILYIDSIKYLFGAYAGNDPPGYQLVLKPFLAIANLDMVAAVQHLLGLGMAVALYVLVLRRGAPRWLAALAAAPVLLDGYQLELEQTVMPDVLFEALVVAGLLVLLWRTKPTLGQIVLAGLLLGSSAPMWEPGEILILPAVLYALIVASGWRRRLVQAVLICLAFAAPILLVSYRNQVVLNHFSLAPFAASTIYGRMAYAADCQTLTLPSYERPLCPPRQLALSLGPDGLDHAATSPIKNFAAPVGMVRRDVATDFSKRVAEQQPLRVTGSILHDAVKLFEIHRFTSPGDTLISRWQFQAKFPQFPPYEFIDSAGQLRFGQFTKAGNTIFPPNWQHASGGHPQVIKPLAKFLRAYQLDGGYTPGPALLIALLAGLAGSATLLVRRRKKAGPVDRSAVGRLSGQESTAVGRLSGRESAVGRLSGRESTAAAACCYVLATGVVVLLLSDTFEFSWRYQLPALITLPPAGVLGITALIGLLKSYRRGGTPAVADGPTVIAAGPAVATAGADGHSAAAVAAGEPVDGTSVTVNGSADDSPETAPEAPESAESVESADGHSVAAGGLPEPAEPQAAGESTEHREPQGKNHASAG